MTVTVWTDIKITRRIRRHDIIGESGERLASFNNMHDVLDWLTENGHQRVNVLGLNWMYSLRLEGRRSVADEPPFDPPYVERKV